MVSRLQQFSRFVHDMHAAARTGERDLAQCGLELLKPILGFEAAWYGWARFEQARTMVVASSTLNLPDGYHEFWSTIESQDLVARGLRENRGSVGCYDRAGPAQTDGMIALSDRYGLRKWAAAMHHRPNRSSTFFVSVYRPDMHGPDWGADDLQLLQCAVDHLFYALRDRMSQANVADADKTLLVDESGCVHLGLEESQGLIEMGWPGWDGEWLPDPLRCAIGRSRSFVLRNGRLVVSCRQRNAEPRRLIEIRVNRTCGLDRLTPREREVARLLADGVTHREAAGRLGLAPATVRNQTQSIYGKLGVNSRARLANMLLGRRSSEEPPQG
jgi:DNA-binding CsgD family transcriptional regulator